MSKLTTSSKIPRPMTPESVEVAARADPDAQPLSDADLTRMKRTPQAKVIRRALELTQEEFASCYHIPVDTLQDWEQGRAEPDEPTRAYLTLIERDPEHVSRILNSKLRYDCCCIQGSTMAATTISSTRRTPSSTPIGPSLNCDLAAGFQLSREPSYL